jgi:hypothetical protein
VLSQPGAAAGESLRLRGSGLDGTDAAAVYLSSTLAGSEWPITTWRVLGTSASGTAGDADELVLAFPSVYGALPAFNTALTATPPPGNYFIKVGSATPAFRSNPLPIAIAPQVNGIGAAQPVLTTTALPPFIYSFSASGLIAGEVSIFIDSTALTIAATLAPGVATVDIATGAIQFELPATGFTSGTYVPVRVIVNGIEAPPGWWVKVP